MNKERIIENWEKSLQLPHLPNALEEIIDISFQQNGGPSNEVIKYLHQKAEQLIPILESPPFLIRDNLSNVDDILQNVNIKLIRDLLLILWIHEGELININDKIDMDEWENQAFVSSFFAFVFNKLYPQKKLDTVFILTFFQNLSLVMISRSYPRIFDGLLDLDDYKRIQPAEQEKVIGADPGYLSAWILRRWGFPDSITGVMGNGVELNRQSGENEGERYLYNLIHFSQVFAEYLLKGESVIKYREVEYLFKELFGKSPHQFQQVIVEVLRVLPKQAALFGMDHLIDLSIIGVLKDHLNLFDKELLTYDDLLKEALKANKKMVKQHNEIKLLRRQIERQHIRDSITGLFNYTYFQEYLIQKIQEAQRYEYPITLILLDIDEFKTFNKTHGYHLGNIVLKQLAELIRKNIRQSDFFARFGSDEFAIVMPYTGIPQSRNVAEKILQLVTNNEFHDSDRNKSSQFTISIGLASLIPDKTFSDCDKFISIVLKALRNSKVRGGNTITQAHN
jgi:diguanylate cyclase (GGDEF)-like protein